MAETIEDAIEEVNESIIISNDSVSKSISNSFENASSQIVDSFESSSTKISDAVEKLGLTLDSISSGISLEQFLLAIFMTFLAGLTAYLFNHFHWKTTQNKEHQSRISLALIKELENLREISMHYWMNVVDPKDSETRLIAEMKIKASCLQVSAFTTLLVDYLGDKPQHGKKEILSLVNNIFDCATGGEFESPTRKSSFHVANKVHVRCSKLISRISRMAYSK